MSISKLQKMRELKGLSREELADKSTLLGNAGDKGHMLATIKTIETGVCHSPKPRKTYEWKSLAKALRCNVGEIMEATE